MPSRQLPRTDDERSNALNTCFAKHNSTADPALILIGPALFADLSAKRTAWNTARNTAADRLREQTTATTSATSSFQALARINSHFIQVFNLGVERGFAPATDRAFYKLPVSHAEVPTMKTCADAVLWAQNFIDGETQRTAADGIPMAWPTISEVTSARTLCQQSESAQTTAKSLYDLSQEAVATLRPGIDLLVKKLWDTIELALIEKPAPSQRRESREWGVIYIGGDDSVAVPPPTPVDFTAQAVPGTTSATISFQPGGPGATEFRLYREGTGIATPALHSTYTPAQAGSPITVDFTDAQAGFSYDLTLRAANTAGESDATAPPVTVTLG